MICLIDGQPTDHPTLEVSDGAVLRGDGCFEAIRSYGGRPFALDLHLQRLQRSAAALHLQAPPLPQLDQWVRQAAAEGGDGVVRVVLTRGSVLPDTDAPPRCLVIHHRLGPTPPEVTLLPVTAPWHPAGRSWELAGAKTLSYAPNQAATRKAQRAGFDEALLVDGERVVLEGPTFSVAWVTGGRLETPSLELHILDSITRRLVLEDAARLGVPFTEGHYPLERVEQADEAMVLSTTREVTPVVRVGEARLPPGPVTRRLAEAFQERVITPEAGGSG